MAISFAQAAAQYRAIAARAEAAAQPVAVSMAETFRDHVRDVTLRRYGEHDVFSRTPSPPGKPPSMVTGHLADSFVVVPGASGGGVGRASAGPTAIYAAVQEFGAVIHARHRRSLMWVTDYETSVSNVPKSLRELGEGLYLNFATSVSIPDRDYLISGLEEVIQSGELERRKIKVFMTLVWG